MNWGIDLRLCTASCPEMRTRARSLTPSWHALWADELPAPGSDPGQVEQAGKPARSAGQEVRRRRTGPIIRSTIYDLVGKCPPPCGRNRVSHCEVLGGIDLRIA